MVSEPLPLVHASTDVFVFADWMASRSEQSPSLFSSSALVLTVIVAAKARTTPVAGTSTAAVAATNAIEIGRLVRRMRVSWSAGRTEP
jgi:hypothetical protein